MKILEFKSRFYWSVWLKCTKIGWRISKVLGFCLENGVMETSSIIGFCCVWYKSKLLVEVCLSEYSGKRRFFVCFLTDKFHNITCMLQLDRNVRKRTFSNVRQTKTQISKRFRTVWLESLFSAWKHFAPLAIQIEPSEDSDQTARMRSLNRIFAGRTCPNVCFLTLRFNLF